MLKVTRLHIFTIIIFTALMVRIGFILFVSPGLDITDITSIDAQAYHQIAQNLVLRQLFTSVIDPPYDPELPGTFRPPLTPFYIASWYQIFGVNIFWARIALALISALSCGLTFYLAQKLFDLKTGIIAGGISIFYPFFLLLVHLPLTEGLSIGISLTLLCLLYSSYSHPKSFREAFIIGVVFGLLLLNKAANITVFSCVLLWSLSPHFSSLKKTILNIALVILFVSLTILPWSLRNYSVSGTFMPVNSNGGWTLYLGNNHHTEKNLKVLEQGNANGWIPPKEVFIPFSDLAFTDAAAWEARSIRLALDFIREHPGKFFCLAFRKLKIFWSPYNHIIDKITWIPILLLSLFGIYSTFKSWQQHILLYTLIVSTMLIPVFFTSMPRFRAPILPFLIIYASAGFVQLYSYGRRRCYADRN